MHFLTPLQQEKLLYFSREQEAIAVYENNRYRWMSFSEVVQSMMLKSRPWKLTLPHHRVLLLPLLFCQPTQIIELGLGGGNLLRFLKKIVPDIPLLTVEYSQTVIDCFLLYFNPLPQDNIIIHDDVFHWFENNPPTAGQWYIYDIYQQQQVPEHNQQTLLQLLAQELPETTCFSINLPDVSSLELQLITTQLSANQPNHRLFYFTVPQYCNIVIHLLAKQWLDEYSDPLNKNGLPFTLIQHWLKDWQSGHEL